MKNNTKMTETCIFGKIHGVDIDDVRKSKMMGKISLSTSYYCTVPYLIDLLTKAFNCFLGMALTTNA